MHYLARDVGLWTVQKLLFLKEYLDAYVQATKSIRRSDVAFIDLFAGPGYDRNTDTGELLEGSPILAMNLYERFRRFVFVDIDPNFTRQLRELAFERRVDRITHVFTGDCNCLVNEAMRHVQRAGGTFCFVDPPGLQAHWNTIARISRHISPSGRKAEVFVLFPYDMALVRFLVREGSPGEVWGPDAERRIDLAMPDTIRWRRIYQERNQGLFDAREARRRFAYLYWMGLKNLGYGYVLKPKLLSTPEGRPLYFLFFASDHQVGDRIMSHILTRPRPFEQLSFPIVEDPWDFTEGEAWYGNGP